ncbi:hypothetical protein TUM3792_29560 [Shewanella sp. MBTL60-007]|nr:hypothetical protein TUM3792_29560 [Shewanella sp. MBTL60-007]
MLVALGSHIANQNERALRFEGVTTSLRERRVATSRLKAKKALGSRKGRF